MRRPDEISSYCPQSLARTWLADSDLRMYLKVLNKNHSFAYIMAPIFRKYWYQNMAHTLRSTEPMLANPEKADLERAKGYFATVEPHMRKLLLLAGSGSHYSLFYFYASQQTICFADSKPKAVRNAHLNEMVRVCQQITLTEFHWDTAEYTVERLSVTHQAGVGACGYHALANAFLLIHHLSCAHISIASWTRHVDMSAKHNILVRIPVDSMCTLCNNLD